MTCDIKCVELARAFLRDEAAELNTEENMYELACEIQQTVEDGIDWLRAKFGPQSAEEDT